MADLEMKEEVGMGDIDILGYLERIGVWLASKLKLAGFSEPAAYATTDSASSKTTTSRTVVTWLPAVGLTQPP